MTLLTLLLLQGIFYPSGPEIYQQGKPLTVQNCSVPETQTFASDKRLEQQKKFYQSMPSPALRSDMALWFGKTRNGKSASILKDLLAKEPNDFVRCDLVKALLNLKKEGISYTLPANFSRFYENDNATVAFKKIAMTLYREHYPATAWKSIFATVSKTPESQLLSTAYPYLKGHAEKLPQEPLRFLHKQGSARGTGSPLHCFAAGLLAGQKLTPDTLALLGKDLKENSAILLRSRIAGGLSGNRYAPGALLRQCLQDPHAAVRLELAKMEGSTPLKLEILQSLSMDKNAFVREEAFRSLSRGIKKMTPEQKQTVFMTLLQGLKDPVKPVRQASVESLKNLPLSAEEKTGIQEQALAFAPAWEEVISYAETKREKSFAPAIAESLDSFKADPVLLRKALQTLGTLRYTKAVHAVMKYASDKDPLTRKSCAVTLGELKQRVSFPVLKKLLRDRDSGTACKAAEAMYSIPSGPFTEDYLWLLKTRTTDRADQRAVAIRALDRLKKLPVSAWKDLETLLLKPCIVEPMMPPAMDLAPVRLSILMLLHNKAKQGAPAAKVLLQKALKALALPQKEEFADPLFDEYFRQFKEFHAGKKVVPGKIETAEPSGAVKPLK